MSEYDRTRCSASWCALPLKFKTRMLQHWLSAPFGHADESGACLKADRAFFGGLCGPDFTGGSGIAGNAGPTRTAMTQQRFGKVIRLFAPLYLSNECINNCKYCGFSRDNPILRVTLDPWRKWCARRGRW